jgi:hypothetical protein
LKEDRLLIVGAALDDTQVCVLWCVASNCIYVVYPSYFTSFSGAAVGQN